MSVTQSAANAILNERIPNTHFCRWEISCRHKCKLSSRPPAVTILSLTYIPLIEESVVSNFFKTLTILGLVKSCPPPKIEWVQE